MSVEPERQRERSTLATVQREDEEQRAGVSEEQRSKSRGGRRQAARGRRQAVENGQRVCAQCESETAVPGARSDRRRFYFLFSECWTSRVHKLEK